MAFIIVLLICVCVVYCVWSVQKYRNVGQYINKFPGNRAYPLVGNLPDFGTQSHEHLQNMRGLCLKYDHQMFRVYAGNQPNIILSSPKDFEVVLSSTQILYKDNLYCFLRPWLGYGLLTSFGQHWQIHRKIITPSFHFKILQDFLSVMNETSDKFIELLRTTSKNDAIFDIQPLVSRSTLDVICETAMGVQVNSIGGGDNDIGMAINDMCHVVERRIFSIIQRSDFLFKLTSSYKKQKRALHVLRTELSKVIEKRRAIVNERQKHEQVDGGDFIRPKMAFLDNLITAEIDGTPLTFEDIFEEVSTFIFEGHDTTASAIIFTLYCLSRNPRVQEKSFKEQQQLFADKISHRPTFQDINDMKYLELVIKETLRLYPSVPVIARDTTKFIEINGKIIPPFTTIVMLLISAGYNEQSFEKPLEFVPERFESDLRERSNPFEYVPFSAGPRNCIGQKFAMMEMKCTISNILRNFEILPPIDGMPMFIHDPSIANYKPKHKYDPLLATFLTLKSENGVWIRLRKRQ